jgi:tripartite-type tricarboxylate transporter receptor subunit TctC
MIGMEAVRNSKPDGYTIASATIGTLSINQFLFKKMPHDPETDFVYASTIWENCNVFMVSPQHPAKNLQELIAWSRAQARGANIGSSAIGSSPYLAASLFKVRANIQATIVPFPGGAQSLTALIAGETDFAIDNIASALPLIRAGKVRAVAVTSDYRWPTLSDVPTTAESGVNEFIGEGIFPAGVSGGGIYPAGVNLRRGGGVEDPIQLGSPYIQVNSPAFHPFKPTYNPFASNSAVQRMPKSGGMIVRV